jgi:hypothetical protein
MNEQVARAFANVRSSVELLFGPEEGAELISQTLLLCRLQKVETPDDLLRFACVLEEHQGALSTIGRAAKAVALMQGAKL